MKHCLAVFLDYKTVQLGFKLIMQCAPTSAKCHAYYTGIMLDAFAPIMLKIMLA